MTANPNRILVVIPARYASSRFPGKPLVDIRGKTMIQRVYEQVSRVPSVHHIIVATDDPRIKSHVEALGFDVMMTSEKHESGTERCAEVVEKLSETYDIVINVQGDEPFIAPELIQEVIDGFSENAQVVTAVKQITDIDTLHNPNVVKVVFTSDQKALYFSRQPIPFQRDSPSESWLTNVDYFKHIGIYGFRRTKLLQLVKLPVASLESAEKLEQLRWLQAGFEIRVVRTKHESVGIDSVDDLNKILHD